jgi:hypothetical protein
MAESKRRSSKSSSRSKKGSSRGSSSKSSGGSSSKSSRRSSRSTDQRSPREVVIEAVEQIQELIGRPVEAVTGMEKNGNEWTITFEVLELERVPNTTDVLATYAVKVDDEGRLLGYKRERRYLRGEAEDR